MDDTTGSQADASQNCSPPLTHDEHGCLSALVSCFPNAFATDGTNRSRPASDVLDEIQNGTHSSAVAGLRRILCGDRKAKAELYKSQKTQLLSVTVGGTFTYRNLEGLETASGLAPLDVELDTIKNPNDLKKAEEARTVIARDPVVAAAFVSPSGAGVKPWVRIPVVTTPDEYKKIVTEAIRYFRVTYGGVALTDPNQTDITRFCFVSHDPGLYRNPQAMEFPGYTLARQLHWATQILWTMQDGERDHTRNKVAHTLGGLVAGEQVGEVYALAYVEPAVRATTLHPEKSWHKFLAQFRRGKKRPITKKVFHARDDAGRRTNGTDPQSEPVAKPKRTVPKFSDYMATLDTGDQPQIAYTIDITDFTDKGIAALEQHAGNLFQRDGELVSIQTVARKKKTEREGNPVVPRVMMTGSEYIQEMANQAAGWHAVDERRKEGWKRIAAPAAFVRFVRGRPSWPFRVLTGITMTPTLRHDGSILDTPGYDEDTGLYYTPTRVYPAVPEAPDHEDARAAYTALCDPFCDFPFLNDCHLSATLAALLSIVARHLIKTPPAFPVRSNVAGAGKGLLVDTITLAATGVHATYWDEVTDPTEEGKRLLCIGLDGDRTTCYDNLTQPWGCAALDRAITNATAKSRLLGFSKTAESDLMTVFFATGNNLRFAGDMARRVVPIDLSSTEENPEARTGFVHQDLRSWTWDEHPRLLVQALTLLKAYILAGKPKPEQRLTPYGSFEDWSDLIRSALVWVEAEDPCLAREGIQAESDGDYEDLRTLLTAWRRCFPKDQWCALSDVFQKIAAGKTSPDDAERSLWGELDAALHPYCRTESENYAARAKSAGKNLPGGKTGSRVIDRKKLVSMPDAHSKSMKWRVADV